MRLYHPPRSSTAVCLLLLLRYVKASLSTTGRVLASSTSSPVVLSPSSTAYPDHETMVARMSKINEILDEARSGKTRPERRYGAETMLLRRDEEGSGNDHVDYSNHQPWGVDDEDLVHDGSGSGVAADHGDLGEYDADMGGPVWPSSEVAERTLPTLRGKPPLHVQSDVHADDEPRTKGAPCRRRSCSWLLSVLLLLAFLRR